MCNSLGLTSLPMSTPFLRYNEILVKNRRLWPTLLYVAPIWG